MDGLPTLPELPAEVDDQLQQQQTDGQEQEQAEEPERAEAVRESVCPSLAKQQGHVGPGAAQHLHQPHQETKLFFPLRRRHCC